MVTSKHVGYWLSVLRKCENNMLIALKVKRVTFMRFILYQRIVATVLRNTNM